MTSESIILISVIVLGLLSSVGLIAVAVIAMRNAKLAESVVAVVGPALVAQRNQTETVLAGYGDQLKPINDLLQAIRSYVDSADDAIYQAIAKFTGWPAELIAAVGSKVWAEVEDMTDGTTADDNPDWVEAIDKAKAAGAAVVSASPSYHDQIRSGGALPIQEREHIPVDESDETDHA